jgi:hypothetical protein
MLRYLDIAGCHENHLLLIVRWTKPLRGSMPRTFCMTHENYNRF